MVDEAEIDACYQVYESSFGDLRALAAARHVLTRVEFAEEMADPRIDKYVALDAEGAMLGMSALAVDLAAVPWISEDFYAARYPEHTARGVVYYLGFTMVDRRRQRAGVFEAMVDEIVVRLRREPAMCVWDMCKVNIDAGLNRGIVGILERVRGC